MRLTKFEAEAIRAIVKENIKDADVYLFGSRVDDKKKGGDIDLLIISDHDVTLRMRRKIYLELEDELGEQKIDIVAANRTRLVPFARLAMLEGIKL
jgi:predicted nucleotidyltransferase